MSAPDPAELRRAYTAAGLGERELAVDPMTQFDRWFTDASGSGALAEPNAMVVATASADAVPSARMALLKAYDERGFVFYTNYLSRKGRELGENPRVSLVFPWHPLERQVVVCGDVERASREESAAYFDSRPHGSRLGAWASEEQSSAVSSRAVLEERYDALQERWPEGTQVPLPDFWGGFLVRPRTVEFWQGRGDRMHDRLRYVRGDGSWAVERLAP
ncbi:MAG: pyridoxamine 5'-phosphate oxidase [Streptosporangiales bacterium]